MIKQAEDPQEILDCRIAQQLLREPTIENIELFNNKYARWREINGANEQHEPLNLQGIDLSGVDFTKSGKIANLHDADLTGANLEGTIMRDLDGKNAIRCTHEASFRNSSVNEHTCLPINLMEVQITGMYDARLATTQTLVGSNWREQLLEQGQSGDNPTVALRK